MDPVFPFESVLHGRLVQRKDIFFFFLKENVPTKLYLFSFFFVFFNFVVLQGFQ